MSLSQVPDTVCVEGVGVGEGRQGRAQMQRDTELILALEASQGQRPESLKDVLRACSRLFGLAPACTLRSDFRTQLLCVMGCHCKLCVL